MSVSFQETALPFVEERYTSFVHPSGLRVFLSRKDFHSSYALLTVDFGYFTKSLWSTGVPFPCRMALLIFWSIKCLTIRTERMCS